MALDMHWIGESDYDRLATVRVQCYAPAMSAIEKYRDAIPRDPRGKAGDYLIATRDGLDVGTSTSLSFKMWLRGGCVPCQGVAYVGTIKTHRRGGSKGERGIASQLMSETLRKAREREEAVTALHAVSRQLLFAFRVRPGRAAHRMVSAHVGSAGGGF